MVDACSGNLKEFAKLPPRQRENMLGFVSRQIGVVGTMALVKSLPDWLL